jgi:pyruvyl transferase EpsO
MNFQDKITQLKSLIAGALTPLIDHDYWYLELPYYTNIGDVLIWQGTEDFLSGLAPRCAYKASLQTFRPRAIKADDIILLQGGGNFGDLWASCGNHDFRTRIVRDYPDNRIIVLPQTVFYADEARMAADAAVYARHKRLTLCARDRTSYDILRRHFSANTVLLLPDMAFCIDTAELKRYQGKALTKNLLLKRTDKELNTGVDFARYAREAETDTADWPSMEEVLFSVRLLNYCFSLKRRLPLLFTRPTDIYASAFFKPAMIKTGVRFISRYNKIYTTRLHGAILCCLLEKPFTFFDNTYGKNSGFYDTWLSDLDDAQFIRGTTAP